MCFSVSTKAGNSTLWRLGSVVFETTARDETMKQETVSRLETSTRNTSSIMTKREVGYIAVVDDWCSICRWSEAPALVSGAHPMSWGIKWLSRPLRTDATVLPCWALVLKRGEE
jgi:hypothetical protein